MTGGIIPPGGTRGDVVGSVDFRIPKASLQSLRVAALRLQEGAVGYYPGSGFVHIDSGRFRTW
jgi:uncharacterized protein YcbK (DUF882 family)